MIDPLDDFTRSTFTAEGRSRAVYRQGSGPAVVILTEMTKGGHFAAFEQPAAYVDEVRAFFRTIR